MGILDINLEGIQEPTVVPGGEYELCVTSMALKESKNGNKYISTSFDVVGEENVVPIFHMLMLPTGESEANDNRWKIELKRFFNAFDIDHSNLNTDNDNKVIGIKGKTGFAILKIEEDATYGTRNIVKRFIESN